MANTEREFLKERNADAKWQRTQQNDLTRWVNEQLSYTDISINDLETDLSDGLKLIALIECLTGERLYPPHKKPKFRFQKLDNVSIALQRLKQSGVVSLVNIDSTDIVDCKLKLIMGLIWTLTLRFKICNCTMFSSIA